MKAMADAATAGIGVIWEHPDPRVRRSVAASRHTSSEMQVRACAAINQNLDPGLQEAASADSDVDVRASAALNANIDPAVLFRLIRDPDHEVRISALGNPRFRYL